MVPTKVPDMKALFASALLGVLLALPVAAQIAGSGTRTEADEHLFQAGKRAAVTAKAEPALSGAPKVRERLSPMVKVDVRAAKRLRPAAGIRVIRGSRVTVVEPGARMIPGTAGGGMRKPQMKLVRVGAVPGTTTTAYGVDLAAPRRDVRERPPTIRINP